MDALVLHALADLESVPWIAPIRCICAISGYTHHILALNAFMRSLLKWVKLLDENPRVETSFFFFFLSLFLYHPSSSESSTCLEKEDCHGSRYWTARSTAKRNIG